MLIAQISDTHILAPGDDHAATESRADNLRQCVAAINDAEPDVVLFTGDTVQHGSASEYARLRHLLSPLVAPLYLVPGNRDDKTSLRSSFSDLDYLQQDDDFLHYVIDTAELRFIGLDSTACGERKGFFCQERQEWLQRMLAKEPDQQTILFIHHPPFDVGDHYINGYRHADHAAALSDIVGEHQQVAALLCGHVHWPIEEVWAGTQARIMPSVAVDVRKGVDETETGGNPVYYLHRVDRGQFKSQAVCAGMSVPDERGAG